jgi:hypothetical protein
MGGQRGLMGGQIFFDVDGLQTCFLDVFGMFLVLLCLYMAMKGSFTFVLRGYAISEATLPMKKK